MGILRGGFGVIVIIVAGLCVMGSECGRMVGGRSDVKDVAANQEVQELGRFVVEEYKRTTSLGKKEGEEVKGLKFAEVVEAEKQVVSGLKYYLKVAVVDKDGERRLFDSVVVVKPWERSKQLVRFEPSGSDNHSVQ
ncbi:hypothetical protein QQ045_008275 [Rhodiola kirilowii]